MKLNIIDVVAPEYKHLVQTMIKRKLRSGERSLYQLEIIRKDGTRLPIEVSTHLICEADGPIGIQGIARDISQRRRREALFVESEQRYRQLVNEATDIIYRTDLYGHFTFVNPVAGKLMERPLNELVGLHFLELIREDYRAQAEAFYRNQVRQKLPTTYFEFPTITGAGTEVWIGQNVQLLFHEGEPFELQAVARDITATKQIEQRLIESERRYRSLFDATPHPVLVYDRESLSLLAVNEAAVQTYGYSREELLSMRACELWKAGNDETFSCASVTGRRRHLRKDGTSIEVEMSCFSVSLEQREAIVVLATDVTERVRAEVERQVMLDVIQSVNVTHDLDELLQSIHQSLKKVVYAENCFIALYSKEAGNFEMPFFVDLSGPLPSTVDLRKSCAAYVFRTGEPILITPAVFATLKAEGKLELVGNPSPSWLGVPLKTAGETIGVLAVQHYEDEHAYSNRDLQFLSSIGGQIAFAIEGKRAEERLRQSEERFSKAFNFTPFAMSLTSLTDLRIIDVNNSFLLLNDQVRTNVIGRSAQELQLWGEGESEDEFLQLIKSDRSVRDREYQVTKSNGTIRTYLTSAEIIELDGEECVLAVTNDITEHRALEEQLRQSQRMEAIGQLAGGVAHDFNNILTAITGYSELSLRRLGISHPVSKSLEQIHKAGTRAAGLTRQLLAFSRRQILQAKVFDPNGLVVDMTTMLQRLIGEDIHLMTILNPSIGKIKADPGQIEQVVLNLVANARDAMPTGGSLTIESSRVHLDEDYAGMHVSIVPGPYILLAVTDTGTGMDVATKERIFEPFFTTKEVGKGTGLGLSTVYGIVKQSGGYIWVYSELGRGTCFKVYIPIIDEEPTAEQRAEALNEAVGGDERILVVEDEEQLRTLARAILEESGYTVLEASNGKAAIEICNDTEVAIDILITDVVMPQMSGRELAETVLASRPQMKVLFMSGYTDDSVVRHGVFEHQVSFLQKPFSSLGLVKKVREVLDKGPR